MTFNNRLTETNSMDGFPDIGRGKVTGSRADNGKFRAPTLRNIKYSAPYMHDGRFKTLDDVINHYKSGGKTHQMLTRCFTRWPLTNIILKALKAFIETFNGALFIKILTFRIRLK
ncbi:MAG: hypothetical protein IPJ51_01670 [Saprospiraceae bacterium]|nr:hypothetical protein [Saprospiraceae bacterium]